MQSYFKEKKISVIYRINKMKKPNYRSILEENNTHTHTPQKSNALS